MPAPNLDRLTEFIVARHKIYLKRQAGESKPWTNNPIFLNYRFCNVYRELDKVTIWIRKNWREPHDGDQHLWFAMAVARYINLPSTLEELRFPIPWKPERLRQVADARRFAGLKIFNGAYIISTQGAAIDKVTYLIGMFDKLWANREQLYPRKGWTLRRFADGLLSQDGFAGFMTGQVVADVKYAKPLCDAEDWHTFAVSGPGSRRGLNRVLGREVDKPWKEWEWYQELLVLRRHVNRALPKTMDELHAQDLQNCLCELDKYLRAKQGEGKPKQKYRGGK